MFRILVDTCVWLDLAKDHRQSVLLDVLEERTKAGELALIMPRIVVDEFPRNEERVIQDSRRSQSSALKRAKAIVDQLGEGHGKRLAIAHLEELDFKLPTLGEAAVSAVGRIESLFGAADVIDIDDDVMLRAARRAIDRRAPFHRNTNNINDALLFEPYVDALSDRRRGVRYAFVTHNTKDFSRSDGDTRQPHADLAAHFSPIRSLYLTSLGEALRRIAPAHISDAAIEAEWEPEPRRLSEILSVLDELTDKVWYGRHGLLAHSVESGRVKVVDEETYPRDSQNSTVRRDIWASARNAAQRVERRYGVENLGPWDDFEWGMLSGKLSALRWVLGDDWDMLDT